MDGERIMSRKRNTFTCTIKVVDKRIATIALYMKSQGITRPNKSQIVSAALDALAKELPEKYQVHSTLEALEVFSKLGYDPVRKGDKGYKAIFTAIKIEENSDNMQDTIQQFMNEQKKQETPETVEQKNLSALRSGMALPDNIQVKEEE